MLDQLNQLNELHQQGALSDEEFTAAKAKLLRLNRGTGLDPTAPGVSHQDRHRADRRTETSR